MVLHNRIMLGVACVLLAQLLSGCFAQPTLFVSPTAIDFGGDKDTATFRIFNTGAGTLRWTLSESLDWLTASREGLEKQEQTLNGATSREVEVITLTVDRAALGPGVTDGAIALTSNGGDRTIAVSVSQGNDATLSVSMDSIDLGSSDTSAAVDIANGGQAPLAWELSIPEDAGWLTASDDAGTLPTADAAQAVQFNVDRTGLTAGSYSTTVSITSNGGEAAIDVHMEILALDVTPETISFDGLRSAVNRPVTLLNNGGAPVAWSAETDAPWLTVTPASGTVAHEDVLTVRIDPAGLAPDTYSGTISVIFTPDSGDPPLVHEVPVSFAVSGFDISAEVVNFGELLDPESETLTLTNNGPSNISWSLSRAGAASPWLDITPTSGELEAGGTVNVQLDADPTAAEAATYATDLIIAHEGLEDLVTVTMSSVKPPNLVVVPRAFDFETSIVTRQMVLWNGGTGVANWRIDTSDFPDWLTLSPVDGDGIAEGSVSGDENDMVTLQVRRELAPTDQLELDHSFTVTSDVSPAATEVAVTARIPQIARLLFEAEDVDSAGTPVVSISVNEQEETVRIANTGNGPLFWEVTGFEDLSWITSVSPSQGTLDPGEETLATIVIDRSPLSFAGAQAPLILTSNDPDNPAVEFLLEVQVPKAVSIDLQPPSLSFGGGTTSDVLEVANSGDPDTILRFSLETTKDWLNVFPLDGQSVGTTSEILDWRTISVSVDRALLEGESASAKIIVSAEGAEDAEVDVSVEVPALTIESAMPRLRQPSLVRTVLLLRNIRYQSIAIPTPLLDTVAPQLRLFESDQEVEVTESSQFLAGPERIRGNAVILLDYSGSMQHAASQAIDRDGDPDNDVADAADPIQALYDRCIPQIIADLPDQYRIMLAVTSGPLSDTPAGGTLQPVFPADGEPLFTNNKSVLLERFNSIEVADNGATALLPAVSNAAVALLDEDRTQGLIPFDDPDVRLLIHFTDGRLTTDNQLNISEVSELLEGVGVRYMPVGWGIKVYKDPLLRLADASGGHMYSTRNEFIQDGENDSRTAVPVVEEMLDWCVTDESDPCDQSIARDLKSQLIFTYVTLNDDGNVTLEGRLSFNDPNDQNSPCIEEQGEISGSFEHGPLDYARITSNPRRGQISLASSGLQADNTADVTMRLEYAPRNIRRLQFNVLTDSPEDFTLDVAPVPNSRGGIIPDWNVTPTIAQPPGNDRITLTLESPDGEPLRFAQFGDLVRLRFSGVTQPFEVQFFVLEPLLNPNDMESKFFTMPDTVFVRSDEAFAPAFPQPLLQPTPAFSDPDGVGSEYDDRTIDLNTTIDEAVIELFNDGGSHEPSDVVLNWTVSDEEEGALFDVEPTTGTAISNQVPSVVTFTPDRSVAPGTYRSVFLFVYDFGALGFEFDGNPITFLYEVTEPVAAVSTTTLDFGSDELELPLTVRNDGQSYLDWSVDSALVPFYLSLSRTSAFIGPEDSSTTLVSVDRDRLSAGSYSGTFDIEFDAEVSVPPITVTYAVQVP
ncbi:MAG: BACON domain-containing protein [Candidatus Hydrogenedentota bacterium]